MKFQIQLPESARAAVINTMLEITHCLVGKRDDAYEKPDDAILEQSARLVRDGSQPLTGEQRAAAGQYRYKRAHGYYAQHALAWGRSVEECEAEKASFPAPEWSQEFQILPAKKITYG